jgi:hypothetical protein
LCIFAEFGRVVKDREIYLGLKNTYGIEDLAKHSPRIDGNTLTCLTLKPELSNPCPPLKEIKWFLDDLTYQEVRSLDRLC